MKVKFLPQEIEIDVSPDESVLQAAQRNNIFIKSVCNGVPNCAECRVRVVEGEHNVLKPSQKELQLIGTAHFVDQRRLSCQLRCFGDITIDLTEQVEKEANEDIKRRKKLGVTKDSDISHAKSGNLIDQDEELLKEVDREVGDNIVEDAESKNSPVDKRDRGQRHPSKKGQSNPQNKRRRHDGSGKKSNNNRHKNRRPNRNKKNKGNDS